ncbi:MAG: DUF262 domain-containing protein [Acidobacteriota bacterium]
MALTFEYGDKTVQEFVHLYQHDQLNLEPGFQRQSVWSVRDRQKLIESICQSCPIPSVFLYKSQDGRGRLKYDVIDGKQRLESILSFQSLPGFRGEKFQVSMQLRGADSVETLDWRRLRHRGKEALLMGYKIQTVEVSGDLSDIIELFVRINSTGKRLTGAEKRHAKYYHSEFLRQASRLAEKRKGYILHHRILSAGQIRRMKHVELIAELLSSVVNGGLQNKKKSLDATIGGDKTNARQLKSALAQVVTTLNRVIRMFPKLRETRFRNSVDFYSLFMFVWKLEQQKAILTDRRRNRQAQDLLVWLSNGVDEVRALQRKAEGARPNQRMFADYLLTVQGDTDSFATRKRREQVLEQLLGGIFVRKDDKRGFTLEQRRLMWNSDQEKKCRGCGRKLTWANFTVDHIRPHSKGGRTSLRNAALLCRSCNARKGNRRRWNRGARVQAA